VRRILLIIGLFLPAGLKAANLTQFWVGDGGYKLARQDLLPNGNCSTCTLTRNWDGTTAKAFGAKNETVGMVLYLGNGSSVDATSVSVAISNLQGPGTSVISYTPHLLSDVTNYTISPIEVFISSYLQIIGETTLSWDPSEYEARDLPQRFRRPCTVNANNDCIPNGGTLWTDRADHDKFYPDALIPYAQVATSSFTVAKSSSQAIWFDIYIATSMQAGLYRGTITVNEGVVVSTAIPVNLLVYNFSLPDTPNFKYIVDVSGYDINYRHQGQHFPSTGDPYLTTRKHYYQFFHRHKFSATIGDSPVNYCNNGNADTPCPEYVSALDGSLYTTAQGYGNAPGVGVGDQIYSIGTYAQWQTAQWSTTDSANFCVNVSSWGFYFKNNFPNVRSFVYLSDEASDLTNTERWATWMSTISACQTSGYNVESWTTANLPVAHTSAPHVQMVASTGWINASSTVWQNNANIYQTSGSTQEWNYNSHPSWQGSVNATEDDGIAPETIVWADWKKSNSKTIPIGHFQWEGTYWTDTNNAHNDNDLFNVAKTFGYDTSVDLVKGHTGFQFANGDGVLVYPGHDQVKTPDYGIDGPIASWRLKMMRRGIQDGDYLTLAYAINPSSTTAIANTVVPQVLWEHSCFNPLDCSYAYGGRSWSNDPNVWETNRESLAQIIAGTFSSSSPKSITGGVTIKGVSTFQ
jgi:hypothetical protein